MNELLKKHNQFIMEKCYKVATKSKCLRKKVGAVLTFDPNKMSEKYSNFSVLDFDENIISSGYNRSLDEIGCSDSECLMIDGHCQRTIHAEIDCIIKNTMFRNLDDKWLFVTCAPCLKCFQFIIASGIRKILYNDDSYWEKNPEQFSYINNISRLYSVNIQKIG